MNDHFIIFSYYQIIMSLSKSGNMKWVERNFITLLKENVFKILAY